MSLISRPHTATVYSTSVEPDADGILGHPEFGASSTIKGQLTPLDPAKAFEVMGVAVERPHKFIVNVSDASSFDDGTKFTVSGRTFYVVGAPEVWNCGQPTDHAIVICRENVRG